MKIWIYLLALTILAAFVAADPYCEDTDGGIDFFVQGAVYGMYVNGTDFNMTDFCGTDIYLIEFSCENDLPLSTTAQCEFGCLNGACNEDIPEFGIIAAGLGTIGALIGIFLLRKRT